MKSFMSWVFYHKFFFFWKKTADRHRSWRLHLGIWIQLCLKVALPLGYGSKRWAFSPYNLAFQRVSCVCSCPRPHHNEKSLTEGAGGPQEGPNLTPWPPTSPSVR